LEKDHELYAFFLMEKPPYLDEGDGSAVSSILFAVLKWASHRPIRLCRTAFAIGSRLHDDQAALGINFEAFPRVTAKKVAGHFVIVPLPFQGNVHPSLLLILGLDQIAASSRRLCLSGYSNFTE
jgi:hypothetical protein